MSLLDFIEIIKILLPGLIALTSIIIIIIIFLLERYITFANFREKQNPYRKLIILMSFALIIGTVDIILFLVSLLEGNEKIHIILTLPIYYIALILFFINIFVIVIGTINIVKEIL